MYRSLPASLAVIAISITTLAVVPAPAHAEGGLLGAIFNAIGRVIAPPAPRSSHTEDSSEGMMNPADLNNGQVRSAEGGPQVSFCVRTCDGRYFPIAKSGEGSPARTCQAMCPAAQTEIFTGSNIENAVSPRGARYTSLANAYVYRDRLVDGCTCNGRSPAGTANIDYLNDATLRSGDIVMTETGPVVFRGTPGTEHKLSDFVPVQNSKRLSNATREKIGALKVMPTRQASTRQAPARQISARQTSAREASRRPEQRAATAVEAAASVGETQNRAPHTNVRTLGFAE